MQYFESYNKLLTTGLPGGYRGYMSRSGDGVAMDLTLVRGQQLLMALQRHRRQCGSQPSQGVDDLAAADHVAPQR